MAVTAAPSAVRAPLEILLQFPPVWLLRDPIHAYRCVGTFPAIGAFEGRHINHMRQRVEPSFGSRCARSTPHTSGDLSSNGEAWAMVPS